MLPRMLLMPAHVTHAHVTVELKGEVKEKRHVTACQKKKKYNIYSFFFFFAVTCGNM